MEVPGLDLDAFRRWYDGERPGEINGDLSASLIAGGKSNLTYEVTDGTSWWIVRRPPLGHVQATAHDMGREYTAMSALADTGVPVPRTYAHCADDSCSERRSTSWRGSTGSPTARRRSSTRSAPSAPPRSPAGWSRCWPRCTPSTRKPWGCEEFGRPQGFLERQVRRWGKQLEGSKTRDQPRRRRAAPAADRAAPGRGPVGRGHRARRLPARQLPGRRRRPRSMRSSTGRWRRSATPAPTSR